MSANKLRRSPLQNPVNTPEFLRTFVFNRAPTSADWRSFKISDLWIHRDPTATPPYGYYVLVDKPSQSGIWLDVGGKETGDVQTLTGDTGGALNPDANGNINILGGSGITTTGTLNNLTIDSSTGIGSLNWIVDTTSPINVNIEEGHFANGGAQIVYNLPAVAGVGDGFAFFDIGGNGFQLQAQGAQTIRLGNQVSSGGGTTTSSAIGDVIWLICGIANTSFFGYSAQGNFTFV